MLILSLVFLVFNACQSDITLNMPNPPYKLVIEGHIEPGQPPVIMLSHNVPYFSSATIGDLNSSFVHGAVITISDGNVTKKLVEINLAYLPDSLARLIRQYYQIPVDTGKTGLPDFSFYTSLEMMGAAGKTYTLNVTADGHQATAVTIIPGVVIPDSIWADPQITRSNDTFYELKVKFHDPADEINYYRYFTKRNSEPFYTSRFGSVTDDKLFNGQQVTLSLPRGNAPFADTSVHIPSRYFAKGDTVVVKICTIDKASYDFYTTLESDRGGGSPFSTPILIKSNVSNGLGIWGGYGSYYRTIHIPRR